MHIPLLIFILISLSDLIQCTGSPPLQLVRPNDNHDGLEIVEENVQVLARLNYPISVVGVVGSYHSGKSFLLNSILESPVGFDVGSSIHPQTEGIWMRPTDLEGKDSSKIILLDTEGFFGNNVSEAYDARIFALATLLSSHLVYNSIKLIDQSSVDYLELLARRTHLLQLKAKMNRTDSHLSAFGLDFSRQDDIFPPLMWVVKDFIQNMKSTSPTEWLLQYANGHHRDLGFHELGSRGLGDIFSIIECHTMFLPATTLNELQDLSQVDINNLTPEFKRDLKSLKNALLQKTEAKRLTMGDRKQPANGAALAALLRFLVSLANQDSFLELPSLFESFTEKIKTTAQGDTLNQCEQEFSKISMLHIPLSEEEFKTNTNIILGDAIDLYKKLLFGFESLLKTGLPTLQVELDMRIKALLASNRLNIIEYLKMHEDRIIAEAKLYFEKLQLPVPSNNIIELSNNVSKEAEMDFNVASKFNSSSQYSKTITDIKDGIQAMKDSTLVANTNLIRELFDTAGHVYKRTYMREMELKKPESLGTLFLLHKKAEGKALESWNGVFRDTNKLWIMKEKDYVVYFSYSEKEVGNAFQELKQENERLVALTCNDESKKLLDKFSIQQKNILPFPDEEEEIQRKAKELENDLLQEWDGKMKHFSETKSYTDQKSNFKMSLSSASNSLMEQNIQVTKAHCHKPLTCARQRLSNYVWFPSKFIAFLYRYQAKQAAYDCFENFHLKKISYRLKEKVIADWIDKDLVDHISSVNQNLWLVVISIVLGYLLYKFSLLRTFIEILGLFAILSIFRSSRRR